MNKPGCLGLSISEISKALMYEFWYDYSKPKYQYNAKLCYMDTDSFMSSIKPEDDYKDMANDVKKRFDTSNYTIKRPLLLGKNKNVVGLMKDQLSRKIMTEFVAIRTKTYSYLIDDENIIKKLKGQKICNKTNTQV